MAAPRGPAPRSAAKISRDNSGKAEGQLLQQESYGSVSSAMAWYRAIIEEEEAGRHMASGPR